MKRLILAAAALCLAFLSVPPAGAQNVTQNQGPTFVDHTLLVEAQGVYVTDPDLATLTFDINSQDKELANAYDKASKSMQQILTIAEQNGLSKNDVEFGALTLAPNYGGNGKTKSYFVQGEISVKIRDFTKIGPILGSSVQEGVVDSRSLTYSLENEEAAKEKAVAQAVRDAVGRAQAALGQNAQKPGAIRYANVDVTQAVVQQVMPLYGVASEAITVTSTAETEAPTKPAPPPLPPVRPQKLTITATVQCAFQIQ